MVIPLGHSILVVMIAALLTPSIPTRPMKALSPQSVQYTNLREDPEYHFGSQYVYNNNETNTPEHIILFFSVPERKDTDGYVVFSDSISWK